MLDGRQREGNNHVMSIQSPPPVPLMLTRALRERCPNCGEGKLFKSYLKQVGECSVCHEAYGHIRADDAPPWLTILIVGHIVVPMMVSIQPNVTWPDWVALIFWFGLTIALALAILPRAKAVFIAIIWRTSKPKPKTESRL